MTVAGGPGPAGFISPDPVSGFPTLTYLLPGFAGVPGDVVLLEPGNSQPSDIIRFPGNGRMYFFSDQGSEGPEPGVLADGPLPPIGALPSVVFPEVGPEGSNGLFGYAPGVGGIGGGPTLPVYDFISDGTIPEPSTALLLCCAVPLILNRRRR